MVRRNVPISYRETFSLSRFTKPPPFGFTINSEDVPDPPVTDTVKCVSIIRKWCVLKVF